MYTKHDKKIIPSLVQDTAIFISTDMAELGGKGNFGVDIDINFFEGYGSRRYLKLDELNLYLLEVTCFPDQKFVVVVFAAFPSQAIQFVVKEYPVKSIKFLENTNCWVIPKTRDDLNNIKKIKKEYDEEMKKLYDEENEEEDGEE